MLPGCVNCHKLTCRSAILILLQSMTSYQLCNHLCVDVHTGRRIVARTACAIQTIYTMANWDDVPQVPANAMDIAIKIDVKAVLETLGSDTAAIFEASLRGEVVSQASRDKANAEIDVAVDTKFDTMKEKAKEELKIKSTDPPETIVAKASIATTFVNFLTRLCRWVIDKLRWIVSKINQGIKWCAQKARDFFSGLWSLISRQ